MSAGGIKYCAGVKSRPTNTDFSVFVGLDVKTIYNISMTKLINTRPKLKWNNIYCKYDVNM